MNKRFRLSVYALALLLATVACTNEDERGGKAPEASGEENRREVLLTLKNKLAIPQAGTKADEPVAPQAGKGTSTKAGTPIATAEENYIRSLDVYVFGSETEGGTYTFQEMFYYRDNAALVPGDWARPIDLAAAAGGDNTTTTLLKLTKGLFVKIYCVANRPALYQTDGGGATAPFNAFQPLAQSAPGQDNNTITPGVPTEADFLKMHTALIDPAAATEDDILATPLPMAGANTTPLDLTDFGNSARTQASFKLTRLVSRFDIANDAAKSRFTLTDIAMAQARRGATFFPIAVLGASPAASGELVTTPGRPFTGANANTGVQAGAFYSYPSPMEDEGYLILKGTYAVNQTESQEVSYRIPFEQGGSFLEINHNHRYTIAITDADIYHLDFTLTVADWADDGSIDPYNPGGEGNGTTTGIDVSTDQSGKTLYDPDTRTVTMPIAITSKFAITTGTSHVVTKTYAGGPSAQQYDWLEVSEPVKTTKTATKAAATKAPAADAAEGQTYTFSLKSGYVGDEYPEAVVEVKNPGSGEGQIYRVVPEPTAPIVSTGASYTLAALADKTVPYIDITLSSIGGSTLSGPEWLTYDKVSSDTQTATYRVSLNPNKQGVTFPDDLPSDQTITLANKKHAALKTDVTVSFTDAVRAETDLTGHDVKEPDDNSYRVTTAGKTVSLSVYSMFKMPDVSIATAYDNAYGTGNNWLPAPSNPTKTEVVNNRRKYTYQIAIPASAGTDAEYQLHKGTITLKDGGTDVKTYTLWRGASNKPYPTGDATIPYYTALKKGAYWWAPVNCGAKHVARNGQADTDGIGNLYQWGRKDATNHGGTVAQGPIDANAIANGTFYKNNNSPYDWLNPQDDTRWTGDTNNPCPDGYRIPTADELKAWGYTDAGTWEGELLKITCEDGCPHMVLPAAGYRDSSDGLSYNRGTYGYCWSSTPSGSVAARVHFGSATVSTYAHYRAYGFSVRCLRK